MSASKDRLRWADVPAQGRAVVEELVRSRIIEARNCAGGFSPGFASRLVLADGRRVFVKAMDALAWPAEAELQRSEAEVAATLPPEVPAPRFLGSVDDEQWIALAFEDIEGTEPVRPWRRDELDRVLGAATRLASVRVPLRSDHPRLGGWAEIAGDSLAGLRQLHPWAADSLSRLVELEAEGMAAAEGTGLVHFDLYPHNILLAPERTVFVDWPHARLGSPLVDLVLLLSCAAGDGIDPEPLLSCHAPGAESERGAVTAILAAHAGFLLAGGLAPAPPGLAAIGTAKVELARGALAWLRSRLTAEGRRMSDRHGRHR
jgi:hypothetical protein